MRFITGTLTLAACLALVVLTSTSPSAEPLSEDDSHTQVELITFGPGDAIWTRFGHVGLLVSGHGWRDPLLFSYGYAPFGEPAFIWGYLRGTSHFQLVVEAWPASLHRYAEQNRTIWSQRLDLTPRQRSQLIRRLVWNARPENRNYLYDHLFDNCSTRVRDLLDDVTGGALSRAAAKRPSYGSFRDRTIGAMSGRLDALLLFDVLSSPNQNQAVASSWNAMYLPVDLSEVVGVAVHPGSPGRALAEEPVILVERPGRPPNHGNTWIGRLLFLLAALGTTFSLLNVRSGKRSLPGTLRGGFLRIARWGFGLWWLCAALLGLGFYLLMPISTVRELMWNENALLCWPTDFVMLVVYRRWRTEGLPRLGGFTSLYLGAHILVVVAVIGLKLAGTLEQQNWVFVVGALCLFVGCLSGRAKDQLGDSSGAEVN